MKLSIGGFTAAGVLVLALGAGAVGGMVGAAGGSSDPAPTAPPVTLHQVAEEATAAPSATPSLSAAASTSDSDELSSNSEPVSSESEASSSNSTSPAGESASEAAERAEDAASRAEDAAERAESVPAPKLDATSAPAEEEAVPSPQTKPECFDDGGRETNVGAYETRPDGSKWSLPRYKCQDGKWVQTAAAKMIQGPTPKPEPVPDPPQPAPDEEVSVPVEG